MIENCVFRNSCKGNHCDQDFCEIRYKLNYLFDQAGLSEKQRMKIPLFPDADGTDYKEFSRLKELQDNILDFVASGKQLYIYSSISGNGKSS